MGLIKTGIKYGAIYGISKQALNTISATQTKQQPEQHYPVQQQPTSYADASGYVHQNWCNGHCGRRCNGAHDVPPTYGHNNTGRDMGNLTSNPPEYVQFNPQINNAKQSQ